MLVPYHYLMHKKVPQYLSSLLPNTSVAINRYPIRHPRLKPLFHTYAYISQTSKYELPILLNSINLQSDELTSTIRNGDKISLSELKKTSKSYMFNTYTYDCIILNCYVCRVNYYRINCYVCRICLSNRLHASHFRMLLILS